MGAILGVNVGRGGREYCEMSVKGKVYNGVVGLDRAVMLREA